MSVTKKNALRRFGMLATVACLSAGSAQAATLFSDSIDVTLTGSIALQDLGVVVSPTVELGGGDFGTNFGSFLFVGESIDIGATSVEIQLDLPLGQNGALTFSDLDFGTGIADATLTSTNAAVEQADLTFTASSFTIDLSDYFFAGGASSIVVQLTAIPVPAGGALLLTGMGAFIGLRRRTSNIV